MAKPTQGGSSGDVIVGTSGKDKLQGKSGDDRLKGGGGDDSIDGGQGTDTAMYDGRYEDYTITSKGTGNDKVTIKDNNSTDGNEGTDSLKHVEYAQFSNAVVDLRDGTVVSSWTLSIGEIDEAGQKPLTEDMINGSGVPADNAGLARNEDAGIELAIKVHSRQGPDYVPTLEDGEFHFEV